MVLADALLVRLEFLLATEMKKKMIPLSHLSKKIEQSPQLDHTQEEEERKMMKIVSFLQ